MNYSVFYLWQSDLPNNRNEIKASIKKAIKNINSKRIGCVLTYDESTWDVAGVPDISQMITQKIDKSSIFICDVSIINKDFEGRKCPNPNVLFELGYAMRCLGWDKVICVFNHATGRVEDLPFDINHKRILTYNSENEGYKAQLSKNMERAIELMAQKGIII